MMKPLSSRLITDRTKYNGSSDAGSSEAIFTGCRSSIVLLQALVSVTKKVRKILTTPLRHEHTGRVDK